MKFLMLIFGIAVFIEFAMVVISFIKEYFVNKENKTKSEI